MTELEEILKIRFNVWNISIVAVTLVISFLNICFSTFLSVFVCKKHMFGPSVRLLLGTFLWSLVVYSSSIFIANLQTLTSPDSFLLVTERTCVLRNTPTGLGYLMMTFSILFLAIERLYSACRPLKGDDSSTKNGIVRFLYPAGAIVVSLLLSSLVLVDKIQKFNTQVILVCLAAKNANTLAQSISSTILLTILTATAALMCFLSKLKINRLLDQFAWFATKTATLRTRFRLSVNVERSAVIFPQALLSSSRWAARSPTRAGCWACWTTARTSSGASSGPNWACWSRPCSRSFATCCCFTPTARSDPRFSFGWGACVRWFRNQDRTEWTLLLHLCRMRRRRSISMNWTKCGIDYVYNQNWFKIFIVILEYFIYRVCLFKKSITEVCSILVNHNYSVTKTILNNIQGGSKKAYRRFSWITST